MRRSRFRIVALASLALACVLSVISLAASAQANGDAGAQPAKPIKELRIGQQRVGKILFLGNSITLHGPAPQIGWTGNWGMAATAQDKDYVHVLVDRITKAAGGAPQLKIKNIATFERQLTDFKLRESLKEELDFQADLVIVAIGENASGLQTDEAKTRFRTAFENLLAELKQHGQPTIIVRSQFWADAEKDRLMRETCKAADGVFVDISKIGADKSNYARAERQIDHAGVAGHPGDKGMRELADALWQAIAAAR